MRTYTGRVIELRLDANSQTEAWVACPLGAVPNPGQYLQALELGNSEASLMWTIYPSEIGGDFFVAAAPIPHDWSPGQELKLQGPLGHGFHLPAAAQHLALAAFGASTSRLLPLAAAALSMDASTAIFTDTPLPSLSSSIEIYPLAALPEALPWADFLALDFPVHKLADLRLCLGLRSDQSLACPAQALILTHTPCSGVAECGVCAVPARRGWKLACQDGPVFDLKDLVW
jgi:hypothetical protein